MNGVILSAFALLPLSLACECAQTCVVPRVVMPATEKEVVLPDFASAPAPAAEPVSTATDAAPNSTLAPGSTEASSSALVTPSTQIPTAPGESGIAKQPDLRLFYEALAPYGEWTQLAPYGWAWVPRDVTANWRPYTTGRWEYSDESGWVWGDDEPWGWAPYHYGRWTNDENLGWAWVPGTVWAPAWVAWRAGPDYCGWAPLPPFVGFDAAVGVQAHGVDIDETVGPFAWSFVAIGDFCAPYASEAIVVPARNVTMIGRTQLVNNIAVEHGRAVNRGIDVKEVEQRSGRAVEHVTLRDAPRIEANGSLVASAKGATEIAMYRATLLPPPVGVRPETVAVEAAAKLLDDEQYAAFRQRESELLAKVHGDEAAQLNALHEREIGDAPDENAIRALHEQHAAELKALEQQHERELKVLEQRLARLRRTPANG